MVLGRGWAISFKGLPPVAHVLYSKGSTEPSTRNLNCLDPNNNRVPPGSLINPDLLPLEKGPPSPDVIPPLISLMSGVLVSMNPF